MQALRGLGHKPDPVGLRLTHVSELVGGRALSPHQPIEFVDRVIDQLQTSTCVAQVGAQAIYCVSHVALEQPLPFPSALGIYAPARRGQNPLVDHGCFPVAAARALFDVGIIPDSRWPFDPARVNEPLPLDVLQHAADARVDPPYEVNGADRDSIRQALQCGFPVGYGRIVDQAFDRYSGGILRAFSDGNRGNHYTLIVKDDEFAPWCLNSWGTDWGMGYGVHTGGFYRVSWDLLADPRCRDFRLFNLSPTRIS